MNKQTKVPVLRFKDESGNNYPEWEKMKIDSIYKVSRGEVLSMKKVSPQKSKEFVYPVYSSQTKNGGLCGFYNSYLYEDCITWTTDGAGAGDVNFRKGKFYATNVCGVLSNKEGYANQCIAEILNGVTRRYVSYVGNPKLMGNVMGEISITVPSSLDEQRKISSFLKAIDDKIDLLDKKVKFLEKYKKGVMQKLFTRELRFKDDSGNDYPDWESRALASVAQITTGSTPSTANREYYGGDFMFVSPGDIGSRYVIDTEKKVSKLGYSKGRKVEKGSVVFVCIGSTIGKLGQVVKDCITNQQINSLRAVDGNSNDFLYSLLEFNARSIRKRAGAQAVPLLNKTDFSNLSFLFPSSEEQQKIASFLSAIDDKIELTRKQRKQTQLFKKGLLQKMFI